MVIEDVRRMIRAIEFSELNVSFKRRIEKHIYPELAAEMEEAVQVFNAAAQKQEAQNGFYEILLNRVDFALVVSNEDHEIVWINKAATQLFTQLRPCYLQDLQKEYPDFSAILTGLLPKEVKIINLHNRPEETKLAVTVSFIQVKGKPLKIFHFKNVQPIIERTETEAWKKLIRVLTHEIMNSLAPIISLAETFSDKEAVADPVTMNKVMETIHKRSKGLIQFVSNYQRAAKAHTLHLSEVLFMEIMENIEGLLKGEEIIFTTACQPPDLRIIADRGQMEQVLINLVKNARDACQGNKIPRIQVEALKRDSGQIAIMVTDNGTGMPEEVRNKVFVPFFTTKKNGTGIGLSFCREIINAHGGSISIASEYNRGTTVTIVL